MTAPSVSRASDVKVKAWDCTRIEIRHILNDRPASLRYRAGHLYFDHDGANRLTIRGELYGQPFATIARVVNVARKMTRWRALCRCGVHTMTLLVTPDLMLGCADCLPLYRVSAWWTVRPHRQSKTLLMASLTGTDPVAQRRALLALEFGPARLGRKRANPTARQRMFPDPWDEEVMELRLLLTGKWPHE